MVLLLMQHWNTMQHSISLNARVIGKERYGQNGKESSILLGMRMLQEH